MKKVLLCFVAVALICWLATITVTAKSVVNVAATMVSSYDGQDLTANMAVLNKNGITITEAVTAVKNGDAVMVVLTTNNNEWTASNQMTCNADVAPMARNGCAVVVVLTTNNNVVMTADLVTPGSSVRATNLLNSNLKPQNMITGILSS